MCFFLCWRARQQPSILAPKAQAAAAGISSLLHDSTTIGHLGLSSRVSVEAATIGHGFQVHTTSFGKSATSTAVTTPEIIKPTNLWQFILLSADNATALVTVDLVNSQWTAVSVGAAGLAKELQQVVQAWPASSGYDLQLITIYQAMCEFVKVSRYGTDVGIVPLTSARLALNMQDGAFDPYITLPEAVVMNKVGEIISLGIENH